MHRDIDDLGGRVPLLGASAVPAFRGARDGAGRRTTGLSAAGQSIAYVMSTSTVTSNDPGTMVRDLSTAAPAAIAGTGVGLGALVSEIEMGDPSVTPAAVARA